MDFKIPLQKNNKANMRKYCAIIRMIFLSFNSNVSVIVSSKLPQMTTDTAFITT